MEKVLLEEFAKFLEEGNGLIQVGLKITIASNVQKVRLFFLFSLF